MPLCGPDEPGVKTTSIRQRPSGANTRPLQFELGRNCGSDEVIEPIVMDAFRPGFLGLCRTSRLAGIGARRLPTTWAGKRIASGRTNNIASAVGVEVGVAVADGVGVPVGVAVAVAVGVGVDIGVGADVESPSGWL